MTTVQMMESKRLNKCENCIYYNFCDDYTEQYECNEVVRLLDIVDNNSTYNGNWNEMSFRKYRDNGLER